MRRLIAILTFVLAAQPFSVALAAESAPIQTLLQPNRSPLVSFRVLFTVGSAHDPKGKEGLAALTAAMLARGGSRDLAYEEILEAMYPLATSFGAQVDKEMTVFTGTTHLDNLDRYYTLIRQMLLQPGFREADLTRLRAESINYLKVSLREGNDEELGKEHLYNLIYRDHPYGHHNAGTITSLEKLTLEDIRSFYQAHYRQGNVVAGLAGGFPPEFAEKLRADFIKLPPGRTEPVALPEPQATAGRPVEILQRETRSTAMSLGFPIGVVRGDADWPALALVSSYFGQHRSMNGLLFQRLREARGLNYGNYSYIEYFPNGMYQFQPDPNLARRQQIFQIWIRPVEPQNAVFALRAAFYEFDKLVRDGLTREAFEATREFLTKHVNVLLQTQDARLGYALDSRFYGIKPYDDYLRDRLSKLTLAEVNQAIRRHLKPEQLRTVLVTKDAEALRQALIDGKPSPITYNSPKPAGILEEDKVIEKYPLRVTPTAVSIRPVDQIFER